MLESLRKTWIGRTFNSYWSNQTWIKNGSDVSILAIISSRDNNISEVSVTGGLSSLTATAHFEEAAEKSQQMLIPPKRKGCFNRTNAEDYLTIVMIHEDGSKSQTVTDLLIPANVSYRINKVGLPMELPYDKVLKYSCTN